MFRTRSRRLAFLLLLIFGAFVILLGLLVLSVGLAISYHDNFRDTKGLKAIVEPEIDYVQYWIGIPYILTGISVACSAVNLRRVSLTFVTLVLSIACVVLSLAGLVVDGPDWVKWKNTRALQRYWEGKDGYACSSKQGLCTCDGITNKIITSFTDCETLNDLATIYGVLIVSFILTLLILLATVFLMVYVLSTKSERVKRSRKGQESVTYKVSQTRGSQRGYEEPRDIPLTHLTHGEPLPSTNRGYESEPDVRIIQNAFESKVGESSNFQNEAETNMPNAATDDGIVMLDPGHFKLGDDDIY